MEERLEPQALILGLSIGPGEGGGQGRGHGVRYSLSGGEDRVGRRRVDDVEVGREFVLGQGDNVGQVERVREDGDDRRGRVQGCRERVTGVSFDIVCPRPTRSNLLNLTDTPSGRSITTLSSFYKIGPHQAVSAPQFPSPQNRPACRLTQTWFLANPC